MKWEWRRVMLPPSPPQFFTDDNGRVFEISPVPNYIYMPTPVPEPSDGQGTEGKEDARGNQPDL